jgi:hypothetical protein
VSPPAEVSVTWPSVGTAWTPSFHAIRRAIASSPSGVWATAVKSPRLAMPVETLFQPCACAPTTAWSMPPARPSKICPYLSTRNW